MLLRWGVPDSIAPISTLRKLRCLGEEPNRLLETVDNGGLVVKASSFKSGELRTLRPIEDMVKKLAQQINQEGFEATKPCLDKIGLSWL